MKTKLVSMAVLGALAFGAAPAAAQTQGEAPGRRTSSVVAIDTWQDIAAGKCYYGDKESCEIMIKGLKMSKKAKDCLIKGAVAGAGALIVGRFNKDLAEKIARNTVAAGATACISALAG
ncbi:hypothetical protein WJM95_17070 [Streptomyces sp. f51]|uniref:hypothetical protein n=1 Tax=Streptomyces sp. f51 TaxID=1827742 RepID=UPI0030CCC636